MNTKDILALCDHTELRPSATEKDIFALIDDAVLYRTASVCIPPCFVSSAVAYARGRIPICTVIGFPCGYQTTENKCKETEEALRLGASEIDMVLNVGDLKSKKYDQVFAEIKMLKSLCGDRVLKVIIETCLLTEEEKLVACRLVSEAGADFIKTSTGFGSGGATLDDVRLLRANVSPAVRVKASGGIRSLNFARELIEAGADRLGASALVKEAKKEQNHDV